MMAYYSWQTPSENLARVTRERAEREDDMFKPGEIVLHMGKLAVYVSDKEAHHLDGIKITGNHPHADGEIKKYDGPTYEKGGRRFVASPEPCRLPKKGEWFYSEGIGKPVVALSSWIAMPTLDTEGHGWTRRILLEVPDLPEEHPCDFCDGKGELLTICERCHGTGGLTKHEFKGGDWVRYKETGKIYQVSNANAFAYSMEKTCNRYEKLPGRPLTTDDLMQVQSGKRIIVEAT